MVTIHRIQGAAAILMLGLLVAAPAALAQEATVTVAGFPEDSIVLRSNSSESFTLDVNLNLAEFVCTGEGSFPVMVDFTGDLGAVDRLTFSRTELNFSVPPGIYGPEGGNDYNETQSVDVTVAVEGTVPENHTHEPEISATFPGGTIEGCQSAGEFPEAQDAGTFLVEMVAPPPSDGGPDGNGTDDGGADGDNGIPAPGVTLLLAAVAAAAIARRRR